MEKWRMNIVFSRIPVNPEKELFIRFVQDFLKHTPLPVQILHWTAVCPLFFSSEFLSFMGF